MAFKLGIKEKSNIYIIMSLIILGVILTWTPITQQRNILNKELQKRGFSLSKSLASSSVLSILLEDKKSLQALIDVTVQEEDVSYVFIHDYKGDILAKAGRELLIPEYFTNKAIKAGEPIAESFVSKDRERFYEFIVPITTTTEQRSGEEGLAVLGVEEAKARGEFGVRKIGVTRVGISTINLVLQAKRLMRNNIILMIIVVVGSILIITFFFSRTITNPIKTLTTIAEGLASRAGDLTQRLNIRSSDEIGRLAEAFNKIVESMHGMVVQIKNTADQVSASAQGLSSSAQEMNASTVEISGTIQQIVKGVTNQAERVEETSKVMGDMSSSVKQVATNAQQGALASDQASNRALTGAEATTEAVERMNKITEVVDDTTKVIRGLGDKSQQIGEITEVITKIADQTNLLALNAAIEAARAGEYGRGFAVVAEEVRKLAEGSAEAARKISGLIRGIQTETQKAVSSVEMGSKEVVEGRKIVDKASVALKEILDSVQQTATLVSEIYASGEEQLKGTTRVVKSVNEVATIAEESSSAAQQVSSTVQELTASMQEMSASAAQLAQMSVELRELVGKFKLGEETKGKTREFKRDTSKPTTASQT